MRPATNNRKIVAFDEMDIFFNDGVGNVMNDILIPNNVTVLMLLENLRMHS